MRYTNFKDLKISAIGFGTMRLPKDQDDNIDYEKRRGNGCCCIQRWYQLFRYCLQIP